MAIGQAFGIPLIICGSEDVDDDANDVFDGVHNYEVITKLGFRKISRFSSTSVDCPAYMCCVEILESLADICNDRYRVDSNKKIHILKCNRLHPWYLGNWAILR